MVLPPGWAEFKQRRDGVVEAIEVVGGGHDKRRKERKRESRERYRDSRVQNVDVAVGESKVDQADEGVKRDKSAAAPPAQDVKSANDPDSNVRDLIQDSADPNDKKWRSTEDMFRKVNRGE